MFNHIEGSIYELNPTFIILECNSIGYYINISLHTFSQIKSQHCQLGKDKISKVKLLIHLDVKEDGINLYGFYDENERRLFRHLISVGGIGPNTAQRILSSYHPNGIYEAIINKDYELLQSIKGIGAKSAQRIIVELQDKLIKESEYKEFLPSLITTNKKEALSALIVLGFTKTQVEKVLDVLLKENPEASSEELIKKALKIL